MRTYLLTWSNIMLTSVMIARRQRLRYTRDANHPLSADAKANLLPTSPAVNKQQHNIIEMDVMRYH
ncbi:MAG: hypothetical protein HRU21_01220 [Pseudomonadales bacterium]|nr:hypothetical protein [Pseudomonadales bacterium]